MSGYWEQRQLERYKAGEKDILTFYRGLEKSFERARAEVQQVINDFYARYADINGVSFAEAQRMLNAQELKGLKYFIERVNASMGRFDREVNNISIKARMSRYEAILAQLDAVLQQLYAVDYERAGKEKLRELYADSYYRTWHAIDTRAAYHHGFSGINQTAVEEAINYPFNGANFSSRLWRQKDFLHQQLTQSFTTMLIQGRHPRTLSGEFAKAFNARSYDAYRLLHTEHAFITEEATFKVYEEDGVEEYQYLATLDRKTCDICGPLDGKVVKIKAAATGVNKPPMHPLCRCTTVPRYADSDELVPNRTRIARDVNGKNITVPANMKYPEWKEKFISSNPKYELQIVKERNHTSDKKQYKEYAARLGRGNIPRTFDEFQTIKYSNEKEYGILKAQQRGLFYYEQAIKNEPQISKDIKDVAKMGNVEILGFEHRLKTKESYLDKIRRDYSEGKTGYEINDIIRYTYGADVQNLTEETFQCIDGLKNRGYNTVKVKNYWVDDANPYNGINTIVQAPNGQKFEIQYHTPESFALKNGELHKLYEEQRDIQDEESERYLELESKMFEVSKKLTVPDNITEVK